MIAEPRSGIFLNYITPLLSAMVALFATACATSKKSEPVTHHESGSIDTLNVIAVPVGLNLDQNPGPDSFSIKVYANTADEAKAIPITKGTLEIVTFDGTFFGRTNLPPVLRSWTFESAKLVPYEFKAHIGTGYEFTLGWGTNKPTHTLMSIAARYTSPSGEVVTSRPSAVTVFDR